MGGRTHCGRVDGGGASRKRGVLDAVAARTAGRSGGGRAVASWAGNDAGALSSEPWRRWTSWTAESQGQESASRDAAHRTRRCLHASTVVHLRVLFFGTDDVSLHTLRAIDESRLRCGEHAGLVTHVDVVCPGDRPSGRGQRTQPVPVKAYALEQGIATYDVPFGL